MSAFSQRNFESICRRPDVHSVIHGRVDVRAYEITMISTLSSASLSVVLEPTQHSLHTLDLREATLTKWPRHNGSRMDMSSFDCLKVLKTVAKCMFPTKSPVAGRRGVYRLLPSSLEELHVCVSTQFPSYQSSPIL